MRVHRQLGFGFLESAYGDALQIEFDKVGIPHEREDEVRISYDGTPLATTYRADFTCFHREYIVELKAIKALRRGPFGDVRTVYTRDGAGRVVAETKTAANCETQAVTRVYDSRGRVTSETSANGSTTATAYSADD